MAKDKKKVAKIAKVATTTQSVTKNKKSAAARDVYLENHEGTSHKFYRLKLEDKSVTSTYGRIGTTGQESIKEFATVDKV